MTIAVAAGRVGRCVDADHGSRIGRGWPRRDRCHGHHPTRDAVPVRAEQAWPVPDALLGGLDVASQALGATIVSPTFSEDSERSLHDGLALDGTGFVGSIADAPVTFTVDLATDDLVPVSGLIIDPLAGRDGRNRIPAPVRPAAVAQRHDLGRGPVGRAEPAPRPVLRAPDTGPGAVRATAHPLHVVGHQEHPAAGRVAGRRDAGWAPSAAFDIANPSPRWPHRVDRPRAPRTRATRRRCSTNRRTRITGSHMSTVGSRCPGPSGSVMGVPHRSPSSSRSSPGHRSAPTVRPGHGPAEHGDPARAVARRGHLGSDPRRGRQRAGLRAPTGDLGALRPVRPGAGPARDRLPGDADHYPGHRAPQTDATYRSIVGAWGRNEPSAVHELLEPPVYFGGIHARGPCRRQRHGRDRDPSRR